jgi:hypothetical protein
VSRLHAALARRALALALVAVSVLVLRVPAARADADPASDTLLAQPAFFPYTPSTPPALERALVRALREAGAAGLPLKVAVIRSPVDLGGIPVLFDQPSRYVRFLDTEISTRGPQPLLVVMPDGLAAERAGAGAAAALRGIAIDARHGSGGLVRTAVAAVERLAAADGHPIAAVALDAGGGGGGSPVGAIAAGAVVALALALAGAARWRLQARRKDVLTVRRDPARELEHDADVAPERDRARVAAPAASAHVGDEASVVGAKAGDARR